MKHLESQLRIGTGLVLALYLVQHLINHGFGIVSIDAAEAYRKTVGAAFQSLPGLILLYGSLLFHITIALRSLYRRSSLRMPRWQALQLLLGLSIPPLLAGHVVANRGFDLLGGVDPNYYYVVTSISLQPAVLVKLLALIAAIWLHMLVGLHFWLRIRAGYRRYLPYSYALAVLIPALACVGIYRMLREASAWLDDSERLDQIYAANIAMPQEDVEMLRGLESQAWILMAAMLLLVLLARQLRRWRETSRGSYRIAHAEHGKIRSLQGLSLLEALREAQIPHASVCGGRARCTTCRVRVGSGREALPAPNDLEARALARINAGEDVRLACQLYPRSDLSITPLVMPQQTLAATLKSGGVEGHEEYVVAMFVDMRDSTNLGERVLAYDRKPQACRDALAGAADMFRRIEKLNRQLQQEFGESVQMGIGIHGGEAIVGSMGPPRTPLLTAVGDNINIAARLEAKTRELDCDLVISSATLQAENLDYDADAVREISLRGRNNQVQVCCFDRDQLQRFEPD